MPTYPHKFYCRCFYFTCQSGLVCLHIQMTTLRLVRLTVSVGQTKRQQSMKLTGTFFYGFIVQNVCQYVQNQPTVVCLKLHVLVSIVCILPIQTYPTFLHRTTGMCIGLATVEISLIKFCMQPYGTKYELYLDNKMTKIQRVGD